MKVDLKDASSPKPFKPTGRHEKIAIRPQTDRRHRAPAAHTSPEPSNPGSPQGSHKHPVVVRHNANTVQHRPALADATSASTSIFPFLLPAVIVLALAALIGLAGMKMAAQKKRARADAAQAQAALNRHLAEIQAMLAQIPEHDHKLDDAIRGLQTALADASTASVLQAKVKTAITVVQNAENKVLDADIAGEKITEALTQLNEQPVTAVALAQQIETVHASGKERQRTIEAKCKTLRDLIMNANAQLPSTHTGRR